MEAFILFEKEKIITNGHSILPLNQSGISTQICFLKCFYIRPTKLMSDCFEFTNSPIVKFCVVRKHYNNKKKKSEKDWNTPPLMEMYLTLRLFALSRRVYLIKSIFHQETKSEIQSLLCIQWKLSIISNYYFILSKTDSV